MDHVFSHIIFIAPVALLLVVTIIVLIACLRLRYERALLSTVFEGSSNARMITDRSNKPILINQSMQAICDPFGKAGVKSLGDFFAENDASAQRFQLLVDNARRGMADQVELAIPKYRDEPTGEQRWVSVAATPVPGRAGTIHWRLDDVTDKKQVQDTVSEEREKLIDFTDNAPVGFFSVNEDGRFLFVNATMARWLGSDIQTLLNSSRLHDHLLEIPEDGSPYDLTDEGGDKQIVELRMKGPAGRIFLASINQSVVHDGTHVRTRAVVHDLTSERQMRQALQESEDRFQQFFDEAPLGIAFVDTYGHIKDCNQALAGILGMKIEALEGRPFEDLLTGERKQSILDAITAIEEGTRLAKPIEVALKGDSREVILQMHGRKFKGRNTVLHFIDLTEQKSLEAQFTQSQKMQAVGQLAGGVAHDFNNLLTAMIGFCDLLLLRHKAGDPSFGDIMQIKQNANRAANLVRQLLAFSRQQQLTPKVLDITDTLSELSHLLRRLIGVNIEMELLHDPELGPVKVDEGQLEQVLINLVVNARDAMDGRGSLVVQTGNITTDHDVKRGADIQPAGDWVTITIKDTGCGIPADVMERIFEPFFTTKEIGSGTGLGLSTVYGIVRQTGGYIEVNSVIGEGTEFIILLPRYVATEKEKAQEAQAKESVPEQKDLTGSACILLVEDEDAVRAFSARALANKGYDVIEANSGETALELLEKHEGALDLMVTDVIMPGIDGPELARQVLQDRPDLPIVFVSGFTEDRFKQEFGDNASFLPKPFTLQQLAEKIKDVLDQQTKKAA